MKKLPHTMTPLAFAFYMAAMMGLLMCLTVVAVQSGLQTDYFNRVWHTYLFAAPIAFVCILLVKSFVVSLTGLTVKKIKIQPHFTPIVFSFYMAALMDLLMCCAIVAFQQGFDASYGNVVLQSYLVGMPIAFGSLMVIRPLATWLMSKTVALA